MLSVSFHDCISGTPQMVHATSELLAYMQQHKGVSFRSKDEMARMAMQDPNTLRKS